ncbi:MAG: thioredoxin family protein [Candidatus Helarchaeota archaeon]
MSQFYDVVSQDTFRDYLKSHENVLVYFWMPWCGACKMQEPVLQQIKKVAGPYLKIARVDLQQNPALAQAYQIIGTPTLMFFKQGKKVRFKSKSGGRIDRLVGAQDFRRLQDIVRYLLNMKIVKP